MNLNVIKRHVAESCMEDEGEAWLIVNKNIEGVKIPDFLEGDTIAFRLGYDLDPPITDLWIDNIGVIATLAFTEGDFSVTIPWTSVMYIHDEKIDNCVFFPWIGTNLNDTTDEAA